MTCIREHKDGTCSLVWSDGKKYHVVAGPMTVAEARMIVKIVQRVENYHTYGVVSTREQEKILPHRRPDPFPSVSKG